MVEQLTSQRHAVMQAAREQGARWKEIGKALSMSKQAASDWYKKTLQHEEQRLFEAHGLRQARKVLDN